MGRPPENRFPISSDEKIRNVNKRLAQANAEAAELLAEVEQKSEDLRQSNLSLSRVNAEAAELVAELEDRSDQLRRSNDNLAQANARSAELVAELQTRREELEWTNTNLKQANEDKKRILGIAAHDLRSGIGGIHGLSGLLRQTLSGAPPEIREQVELLHLEGGRLLNLLENLLDESRAQMGKLELRVGPVDLMDIVRTAVRFHNREADAKSQTITIRATDDLPQMEADAVRLRQVLDNLLSNAIKYSPPSTNITVDLWVEKQQVGIAILDEGPGLTDEDLSQVFGEFTQLSAKPTAGESSHGLGLAIVKRIVEQHSGRIWAENRDDSQGSRFALLLPAKGLAPLSCQILVVDDQALNRMLSKKILERSGHTVEIAKNGSEAIQCVEQTNFDLVLMDVEMPGMNGLDATRAIRESGKDAAHLPIIAVTGHTDPSHLSECLDAGMNDSLVKPVLAERMDEILAKWVRPRHLSSMAA